MLGPNPRADVRMLYSASTVASGDYIGDLCVPGGVGGFIQHSVVRWLVPPTERYGLVGYSDIVAHCAR